jgi:hypothetical protein
MVDTYTKRHGGALMPWKDYNVLDQRLQFIADVQRGDLSMAALSPRALAKGEGRGGSRG